MSAKIATKVDEVTTSKINVGSSVRCFQQPCNDGGWCKTLKKWAYLVPESLCEVRKKEQPDGRYVEHINTGKRYKTIALCAEATGIGESSIKCILCGQTKATKGGQRFQWVTVGDYKRPATRKVLHVETGRIYDNAKAAAAAFGSSKENMYSCLIGKSKSCKGNHFEYVEG